MDSEVEEREGGSWHGMAWHTYVYSPHHQSHNSSSAQYPRLYFVVVVADVEDSTSCFLSSPSLFLWQYSDVYSALSCLSSLSSSLLSSMYAWFSNSAVVGSGVREMDSGFGRGGNARRSRRLCCRLKRRGMLGVRVGMRMGMKSWSWDFDRCFG